MQARILGCTIRSVRNAPHTHSTSRWTSRKTPFCEHCSSTSRARFDFPICGPRNESKTFKAIPRRFRKSVGRNPRKEQLKEPGLGEDSARRCRFVHRQEACVCRKYSHVKNPQSQAG